MLTGMRAGLLRLLCAVYILFLTGGAALAECKDFEALAALTVTMRSVVNSVENHNRDTAQTVGAQLKNIDFEAVRTHLGERNMMSASIYIDELARAATVFSHRGKAPDLFTLSVDIRNVERLLTQICQTAPEGGSILDALFNTLGKIGSMLSGLPFKDPASVEGIALLLVSLTVFIAVIYLCKVVVSYALGMLRHKKFCHVAAHIRGNGQEFHGHLTRASLYGVRFEFENDISSKGLAELMASPEFVSFDLQVGDNIWPVFVDRHHGFFAPLYFLTRLKRDALDEILARSKHRIRPAPSIAPRSNYRKWREEIKKRKAEIESITRQRTASG